MANNNILVNGIKNWLDSYGNRIKKAVVVFEFRRWTAIQVIVEPLDEDSRPVGSIPVYRYSYPDEKIATVDLWEKTKLEAKNIDLKDIKALFVEEGIKFDQTPALVTRLGYKLSRTTKQ